MKKLKKSLSVLLTLVMLFTTFCFFPLDLGAIEAEAAIAGIKIVVPETLYLTPSTSAQTAIQYYINNNADGSVKTSQDTTAEIHITYPGATLTSISAKTSANITLPTSITGLVGTTFGTGSTKATGTFALGAGLSAGSTALVEWTFEFTVNGKKQTHYAYSVAYAPYYQPVGAAAEAWSGQGISSAQKAWLGSIAWVEGVHSVTTSNYSGATAYYPRTDNFLPTVGAFLNSGFNNNRPSTNWIQSSSNGLNASVTYLEGDGSNHRRVNVVSPLAKLTVDTSRYTNFNQIPNFKVGYMITDSENTDSGKYYLADYTGYTENMGNSTDGGGTKNNYGDNLYNDPTGTKIAQASNKDCAVKYHGAWNKAIATGTVQLIGAGGADETGGTVKRSAWNYNYVQISVTGANKGTLRTNVLNGTSYAKENYTSATWNEYYSALKTAATNLGNPTSATVDTSTLTTKEAALKTTVYFNGNGGSASAASDTFVIGGNNIAAYTATATASRAGYVFKGWATTPDATTGATSFTLGFNQTLYAVWQPKVVFDNLIDLKEWKALSPSNATVSDFTDTGFTLTSNEGVGEGTFSSPFFPVEPGKQYKIDVDFEGDGWDIYIFFCDENGTWVDFADGPSNRYSSNGSTGIDPDNAVFTAPNKAEVVKAQIRVDANNSNNTVKFDNIRVYEEGKVQDDIPYFTSQGFDYGSTYGDKLPTPTKYGYVFKGWVDENGNAISSSAAVDFMGTKYLYSSWEIGKYTFTFDTDGGSAVAPITKNYNTAVTAPQNPTKTGYAFSSWDKTIPSTMPGEDMTFKALWTANTYTVSFNANGGEGTMADISATYDKAINVTANSFTKVGYSFSGWSLTPDGEIICGDKGEIKNLTAAANGNVTLYAVWTINQYTVTYNAQNGTQNIVQTYDYNADITAPADPTKEGYTFGGWVNLPEKMPAENIIVNADWGINQYTITFDTDGGTLVAPITQDYNSDVTAPQAPTKEGYTFAGWDTAIPSKMPAANMTIKATWTANGYVVNYDTVGGSEVASQNATYDENINLAQAPTKVGYTFSGWSFGGVTYNAGDTVKNLATSGEVTVTAVWTANTYTVVFDKNDAAATGTTAEQTFTYDEAENLNSNGFTKTGWTFLGWAETADGEVKYENGIAVINLTAEANGTVTLYAKWEINTCKVTFNYKNVDGSDATVTLPSVDYGTPFEDIVPEYSDVYYLLTDGVNHYNFSGWENKADTITSDVTFNAEYVAEKHTLWDDDSAEPGCVDPGVKAEGCDCGYRYKEEIAPTGHTLTEIAGTNTATCTEGGTVGMKCTAVNCDYTTSQPSAPLGHIAKEAAKENNIPATCTQNGSYDMVVRCERCNEALSSESFTTDATGHIFGETVPAVAPGCTTEGRAAYKECTVCKKFFAEEADEFSTEAKDSASDFTVDAAGHETVKVEAVASDCENDGNIEYYTCENCDLLFADADATDIITAAETVDPADGHNYVPTVTNPTCTADGYTTHTCSVCGDSYVDSYVDPLGHTEGTAVEENREESSCTVKGSYNSVVYCSVCGEKLSTTKVELPLAEHKYEAVVTPPTCTADGYTTYTCSACSDSYTDNETDKLGHTKGAEVIENEVDATCITDGSYDTVTYCTVCGAETSRVTTVVGSLGHTAGAAVKENIEAATCTGTGSYDSVVYCMTCREVLSRTKVTVDPLGHKYDAVVTTPTCTADGYTTYTCSVCGDTYTDNTTTALGHTAGAAVKENEKPATCTTGGSYDEVVYCTVCTAELDRDTVTVGALGHKYDAVVTNPTCTTGGYTTYTCSVCGDTYTDNATTALGHNAGEPVVENNKPASCLVNGSYEEVVYCSVCKTELSRTPKTHVAPGHTEATRQENVTGATCTTPGSYDNITYCSVCDTKISTEHVTGVTLPHTYEQVIIDADHLKSAATCVDYAVYYYDCKDCEANAKAVDGATFEYVDGGYDADNHTLTTTTIKDVVDVTCYSDGHTGNAYHDCCNTVAQYGSVISKDTVAHTPGAVVVENNVLPTCYLTGSYDNVTYCSVCENAGQGKVQTSRETVTVGMVAHTAGEVVVENEVPATCYATGSYDNVTYCSVCKAAGKTPVETSRETVIVAKTAHTPAAAASEDIVPATCYSEGSYNAVVYCSVAECRHKISSTPKTIAKIAHTPAEAVEEDTVPATCYSEGSYNAVVYCSVEACHEKLSTTPMTIAKIAHTPGAEVIENNVLPTCYSTGSYDKVTYCTVCKAADKGDVQVSRETVTVDMVGHTPAAAVTENVVAPKCEEDGHHDVVVYCSVCAAADKRFEISRETVVDARTGHTAGEAKRENNVPATCTENGSYDLVVRCTKCNEIITSEAKVNVAPGHSPKAAVRENVNPATCTEDGSYDEVVYCNNCTDVVSRVTKTEAAKGHSPEAAVTENEVKATCTTDGGYDTVVYCSVCDTQISRTHTVIPATGHTPDEAVIENDIKPTCTADGSFETVVYCGICGVQISRQKTIVPATGHTAGKVKYENVTDATATTNGQRDEVYYCTVCGEEISRETVEIKPVRKITFIMHDRTVVLDAYTGDTVTAPEVNSYTATNGFIHQFKSWDKEIAVVTGDATYTAAYTEPCDYTEFDKLNATLEDILSSGLIDDETYEEYKDQIEDVKAKIEEVAANRNTLDKSQQTSIDAVVSELGVLVDYIYPDVGSTLEIVGASTFYTGSVLDLKAVKMPANTVLSEVQWTSSDDSVVFFSNGRLFAIGVGTVTLTAKRGILTATKTINVVEGGDVRAINFVSMDKAQIIVEDYFTVFNAAGLYWSNSNEIRFRVHVYQSFPYETYIVYVNGVAVEPDENGYYTVPADSGNVRVSLAGAVYSGDDGSGSTGKWSFWEWLLSIFRKIAALFGVTL